MSHTEAWKCASARVCVCVTCHVAVDQLRMDGSAAVHVDVETSRCAAAVFVRLAGALIHGWEEKQRDEPRCASTRSQLTATHTHTHAKETLPDY